MSACVRNANAALIPKTRSPMKRCTPTTMCDRFHTVNQGDVFVKLFKKNSKSDFKRNNQANEVVRPHSPCR